jgi:hypothetical protein
MKFTIRIPTAQYAYLEAEFTGEAEEAIAEHNRLLELYNASQKAQNTPNLQPIPFLRLLHKYMVENRLEMEDVESLGTDKLYSQKDVVNLIKNVFAKITREANGGRINKEVDIRYN